MSELSYKHIYFSYAVEGYGSTGSYFPKVSIRTFTAHYTHLHRARKLMKVNIAINCENIDSEAVCPEICPEGDSFSS